MRERILKAFCAGSVAAIVVTTALARAESLEIESSDTRVMLVELYTSEGCSSCPPADRWLSSLTQDDQLWRQFVPVAFHVDYWNYIGWPDRFASPAYSERQRQNARRNHMRSVYTPGFFLNGEEWRSWFSQPNLPAPGGDKVGNLTLTVQQTMLDASFAPHGEVTGDLILNVALLGFDLTSDVKAGENRNRRLRHDFAVLGYQRGTMNKREKGYRLSMRLPMNNVDDAQGSRSAIAAWVTDAENDAPIQAAGGWLVTQQ